MAGDAEFGNNCNIPKKSKQKKNIISITGAVLIPDQCAMQPNDLDNNSLLLHHSTYDPNLGWLQVRGYWIGGLSR
jgi:hypothetical protein